jgi:hypothetical protein
MSDKKVDPQPQFSNFLVIRRADLTEFERIVNVFLAKGFIPVGGITATPDFCSLAVARPVPKVVPVTDLLDVNFID